MSSTKNPDNEAEIPARMTAGQKNDHADGRDPDAEGQQGGTHGGKKPKMAPRADAPPGLEQDSQGNVIPLAQRTKDDQEKALSGRKDD